MNKRLLYIITLLSVFFVNAQNLKSPNSEIELTFSLTKKGVPTYKISYKDQEVIKQSKLGLELKGDDLISGFTITNTDKSTYDNIWETVWGEESSIRNHYNELSIELLQEATNRKILIRFRAFDEGVGFRYEFPKQDNLGHFIV